MSVVEIMTFFKFCFIDPKDKPETTAATTTENPNFKHDIDCYTGNGENYQGTVSTTHQNLPCSDWSKNRPNYSKLLDNPYLPAS